ncbi:efflux RND transporter permease subunit [Aestuariicella hydrocarbonica]|uniref:Efflux RND transporter permease subunit n=1 Tax=Pseudomaricurvus hydrocarbonicus TaxID=1470433 RepID=A0A9E5MGP7_9GAMM|nr:efflux RND transporter permease subunit [Aestuariicella hydrocarbonica]NHO64971.1 efflux RND transporter permease subunit [Aestuariicella hydrocarbonica]
MRISELSVQRPVFATVIALLIAAFGVLAFLQLTTREYPDVSPAQISISTSYTGASADVIETRITKPIEDEISGVEGIRSIRSSSTDGISRINIEFTLNRDIDAAANDIRDKVSRALRKLPDEADPPQVAKADSDASPIIYISLESESLPLMELTDYAERYVIDRFSVVPGVSTVNVFGSGAKSMRIWVDRDKLAARQLTVSDLYNALQRESIELPAGRLESVNFEFPVRLKRNYQSEQDFKNLVLAKSDNGHLIRLGEVAQVQEGSETNRRLFITNGRDSMAMGIIKQSNANTVDVLEAIQREIELIRNELPPGMMISTSGDASAFIRASIKGVYWSIILTTALVALVIFLFLGQLKVAIIPVVCIPLSLIGSTIALNAFGFSINLITLLAMVLAIGLVVDDAIVVLENIYRRIEEGEPPLLAAARGAAQVGFAVIATTLVLIAVFTPITFMQDNTGRIFSELAVAICASVILSTFFALTIVPMLCSKLLKHEARKSVLDQTINTLLENISAAYGKSLRSSLKRPWLSVTGVIVTMLAGVYLLNTIKKEYAPLEDKDTIMAMIHTQEGTGLDSMNNTIKKLQQPLLDYKEETGGITRILFVSPFMGSTSPTVAFSRISLVPWNEREFSAFELREHVNQQWRQIPGIRAMTFMPSGLTSGSASSPVQFVIQGPTFKDLSEWRDIVMDSARASGLFGMLNSDLKETQQQIHIDIDNTRAATLGISVKDIGETLQSLMTESEVTTYSNNGEEYPVIVQLEKHQRMTPDDILNIDVRSSTSGELIKLSNLIHITSKAGISTQNRYNRMRAVTISAGLAPSVTQGEALAFLEQTVADKLPAGAKIDYRGESLEYKDSSGGIYFTFGLALLVLFLVMAAQFESFIHPTVIIMTVPLAVTGGLMGLLATGITFNIFSQIALLMLIGIATKSGILLVEFINQLRDQGIEFNEAIIQACQIRMRPVLMTTISTLAGAIPLVVMAGPGSVSRNILGVVILFGVAFSTVLTLYIIPGLYKIIAKNTTSPEAISRTMQELDKAH